MHWIYLTSLFFISVVGYNESISKQAVLLAQLAYCPNEKLDIEYIDIENYGSKAIVGYDNYTEMIFIFVFQQIDNTICNVKLVNYDSIFYQINYDHIT